MIAEAEVIVIGSGAALSSATASVRSAEGEESGWEPESIGCKAAKHTKTTHSRCAVTAGTALLHDLSLTGYG